MLCDRGDVNLKCVVRRFEGATGRSHIPGCGQKCTWMDDSLSFASHTNALSRFHMCSPHVIDRCAQHVSRANEELAIDSLLVTDGLFRSRCAVCMAWYLPVHVLLKHAINSEGVKAPSLATRLLYLCVYM